MRPNGLIHALHRTAPRVRKGVGRARSIRTSSHSSPASGRSIGLSTSAVDMRSGLNATAVKKVRCRWFYYTDEDSPMNTFQICAGL